MFHKVLVVCLGNICRSPVAEALLNQYFQEHGIDAFATSAGIEAMLGDEADDRAKSFAKLYGQIDLQSHRGKQLTASMMQENDLVFVMELEQKKYLQALYPFAAGKIECLGRWKNMDILDPYRASPAVFRDVMNDIQQNIALWVEKLWSLQK